MSNKLSLHSAVFIRVWLVYCKSWWWCRDVDICMDYLCQWNHPDSNDPMQEVLKCFHRLDDWKCLGDLWHLTVIILLPVLQCCPLNLKVLHYMCPLHVGCCQVSAHCIVVSDDLTSHKKPLLGFSTKGKGRCWNSCSSSSIGAWVGDSSSWAM